MPRPLRHAPGGMIYHVINRAAARHRMLRRDEDFAAFERVLTEALQRHPMRLLGWCVMGNHWHFVVWPRRGLKAGWTNGVGSRSCGGGVGGRLVLMPRPLRHAPGGPIYHVISRAAGPHRMLRRGEDSAAI